MRAVPAAALAFALAVPGSALAVDIWFRNFSGSAAIGPPADAYAAKLADYTLTVLGPGNEVRFRKISPMPAIPARFGGDIVAAVGAGAGSCDANGLNCGFDAAYSSGSELNKAWGFIYNSGVPFGPSFEEHIGFLYGKSVNGTQTGLELIQSIFDARSRNVIALPIVGSAEQLSGYFPLPIGNVPGMQGIGLEGFCQQPWTLRYLSPGENVLQYACDALVASGAIPSKGIRFIAAIPGGGSLTQAVNLGQLQGFEFATPLDDVSQLFVGTCTTPPSTTPFPCNPGTVGVRYVHFPGWQQQFLITWMIVNKGVWDGLTPQQRVMVYSVARDHVISSYGENMRQQGPSFRFILDANKSDGNPANDMAFTTWPKKAQEQLRDATIRFLNDRRYDASLPAADREDYATILEAYRKYVLAGDVYWDDRAVETRMRFSDWKNEDGEPWQTGTAR
jgi:hypothetical protein